MNKESEIGTTFPKGLKSSQHLGICPNQNVQNVGWTMMFILGLVLITNVQDQ